MGDRKWPETRNSQTNLHIPLCFYHSLQFLLSCSACTNPAQGHTGWFYSQEMQWGTDLPTSGSATQLSSQKWDTTNVVQYAQGTFSTFNFRKYFEILKNAHIQSEVLNGSVFIKCFYFKAFIVISNLYLYDIILPTQGIW